MGRREPTTARPARDRYNPSVMSASSEFVELVEAARGRCLWFFAPDDLPAERDLQIQTLDLIKRYGNREDYLRARRLEEWLRRNSSAAFSIS